MLYFKSSQSWKFIFPLPVKQPGGIGQMPNSEAVCQEAIPLAEKLMITDARQELSGYHSTSLPSGGKPTISLVAQELPSCGLPH